MAISDYPTNSRVSRWLENKRSGWIISAVILVALVGVLLLPPVSLVQRISDMGLARISEAGGVIGDPDGTQVTFLPGTVSKAFRAKLTSVPRVAFLEGSAGSELLTAAKAIPPNLVAKSPYYQLTLHGTLPTQSSWVMPIPNDSEPYETLDVYTWDKSVNRWQWVPHNVIAEEDQVESRMNSVPGSLMIMQTNPLETSAGADVPLAGSLASDSQGALAQVHPTGIYLSDNGGIEGTVDSGFEKLNGTYAVVPVIRNYNGPIVRSDLLANMLTDQAQRDAHIDALVNLAVGSAYSGIDIDYHGLDPTLKADFNQFVARLAGKLHAQNKTLGVRVEQATQVAEDRWDTGAYDWTTLGLLVDTFKVPAPIDPQAFVPGGQFETLLRYAVGQVDRYKLEVVFSGQSVEQAGGYFLLRSYGDALQPLIGRIQTDQTIVKPGEPLNLSLVSSHANSGLVYDPNLGTYVYRYADDQGNARTVWLENAASLSHKLQMLGKFNVRGFSVENLPAGGQDPDLWTLMRNYQQGKAQPVNSNFVVEWTVKDSQGGIVTESRPLGDTKLALAAPAQPGELQIQADIKDRGQIIGQATASGVAVATYTPTASPTPEFTPTPAATATPSFAQLTVNVDQVNVRSGPGTDYAKVGTLKQGDVKKITGKNEAGDWVRFQLGETDAWVLAQMVAVGGAMDQVALVKVTPAPTAVPAPQQAAAAPAAQPAAAPALPAAPAPAGGGSFGYGIQIADYNLDDSAGKIQGMGFNWVKKQLPWKDLEGSPGNIDWGGLDGFVGVFNGRGINILLSIPKAPTWARPGNTDQSVEGPPADPNTYARFVGQVAGRYCGKVNAIEVWNEQNLWYEWGHEAIDPARYVQLLAAAYRTIKAACPSTYVVSGALTPTGANPPTGMDDMNYLQGMYAAGLRNYEDGIGAHPSGYNLSPDTTWQAGCAFVQQRNASFRGPCDSPHHSWSFLSTMQGYRAIMVANGDANKRIWPTEFGWAVRPAVNNNYGYANDNSPEDQAAWTVRAYQLMRTWGYVGPAFLWNLNFNVTNPGTELAQWGIVGRPTYGALAGMAK